MSDPVCCILGVCCPPGSDRQREALTEALGKAQLDASSGIGENSTRVYADFIIDHFDLAPKGSLEALVQGVARMAKGNAR